MSVGSTPGADGGLEPPTNHLQGGFEFGTSVGRPRVQGQRLLACGRYGGGVAFGVTMRQQNWRWDYPTAERRRL